jgi:hypothetical protein
MVDQVGALVSEPPDNRAGVVVEPSSSGITWRLVVTGVILMLLAYGTFIGSDHDWPFGPLRQYATSTPITSQVLLTHVYGVHASGRTVRLNTEALGLRVAELDGQLSRLRHHPKLLLSLAVAYHRIYPDRAPLVRLILARDGKLIRDRKPVRTIHRVMAVVNVP